MRDLYRPDPDAQARVLEALAAGSARGRREADLARSTPDRAAAAREVEALLRRVHDVTEEANDVVRFYLAGDGAFLRDVHNMTAGELAALVVDRVLGPEDGRRRRRSRRRIVTARPSSCSGGDPSMPATCESTRKGSST